MAKYKAKRSRTYRSGKSYRQRDPYLTSNSYKSRNTHNPRRYKSKPRMRRGYSPRLYFPSRRTENYRLRSMSKHKPVSKQSLPKGNPRPWTEPKQYKLPQFRIEPDTEQIVKWLQKQFDKELQEQMLQRLEAEFEKFQEALTKEKTEQAEPKQNETEFQQKEIETQTEPNEYTKPIEPEEQSIEAAQTKTEQAVEEIELTNEEKLYQIIDDYLDWLKEQVDETELLEVKEENEARKPEPVQLETLTAQKSIEQPIEVNETPLEISINIKTEQLEDLESILEQIEQIEPEEEVEVAEEESEPVE